MEQELKQIDSCLLTSKCCKTQFYLKSSIGFNDWSSIPGMTSSSLRPNIDRLGPTPLSIQRVPGFFSREEGGRGEKFATDLHIAFAFLQGAVISYVSGTNLSQLQ